MAKPKAISKQQLQSLVAAEIASAMGNDGTELQAQRTAAMKYYQAEPFGNEIDGRSTVVSTDVRDTVEWIMPTLMRIFTGGDDTVQYEPVGPEDVEFAKQATEYGNFIWMRDNPGFLNFYSWFKDALVSKNGIVKIWWEEEDVQKRERYYGLDEQTFATIVNAKDVTVSEHTENKQQVPDPMTGEPVDISTHDLVITRTITKKRVCVMPVPPEEFLLSRDGRNIQDARFAGHRKRTTLSDLRADGYKEDLLSTLGSDADTASLNVEEIARDTVETNTTGSSNINNDAMATVWVTEAYVKADVDGDGIAEMRKVTVAGPNSVILSDEPWDDDRPFASITPIIMPHRFWGLSVADLVMDLQLIRSTLFRQFLDNAYANNNQRMEVVESAIIDPTEVLSTRPGGVVRVKAPGSITPIAVPQIGDAMLAGLEYVDRVRETRTGVSEKTQGLGKNPLHDTASGEQILMTAAMGKIELIARVFAETGVKDAFKLILKLVCRYQTEARQLQLKKNEWAAMDPRPWNEDMDVTISVGMGTGDKEQQLQHALLLGQLQQGAMQIGMATPDNLMNTAELLVNAMGLKGVDRFFTKPQPGQQPPNPEAQKAQAKMQIEQAKLQAGIQRDQAKAQLDARTREIEAQNEMQLETKRMMMDFALKRYQIDQEIALKQQEMVAEFQLDRAQTAMDFHLAKEKNRITAHTQARKLNGSSVHIGGQPG